MVKQHYWVPFGAEDDDEVSMDPGTPLVTLATATRAIDDTAIRAVFWHELVATVGTASLPNVDWVAGAAVDYLVFFDTESDSHAVNITDADPYTMGFSRANKLIWTTTTTNKYQVLFQGPAQGVNLEGQRKGYSASNLPSVSFQRWVSDNYGVFFNAAHYSVLFTSRVVGRVLWASDLPAP